MNPNSSLAILLQTSFLLAAALLAGGLQVTKRTPALRSAIYRAALTGTILLALISPSVHLSISPLFSISSQLTRQTPTAGQAPPPRELPPSQLAPDTYPSASSTDELQVTYPKRTLGEHGPDSNFPEAANSFQSSRAQPSTVGTSLSSTHPLTGPGSSFNRATLGPLNPTNPLQATRTKFASIDWLEVLTFAYLAGAAALLTRLALGFEAIRRLKSRCRPLDHPLLNQTLETNQPNATIFEGPAIQIPMVAGFPRPSIFLPEGFVDTTNPSAMEATLRHEIAHLRNHDLPWNLLQRLAEAFLWPNPLVWLLGRQMRDVSEELGDAYVLQGGIPKRTYATYLLDFQSRQMTKRTPGLALGMVNPRSSLTKRVEAILALSDSNPRIGMKATVTLTAIGAAFAGGSLLLFAQGPTAPALPNARAIARSRMKRLTLATLMYANDYNDHLPPTANLQRLEKLFSPYGTRKGAYYLNGKLVNSLEESNAFDPPTPGARIEFNPNALGATTVQLNTFFVPIWREFSPDSKSDAVVGYLDGHVKTIGPEGMAQFEESWRSQPPRRGDVPKDSRNGRFFPADSVERTEALNRMMNLLIITKQFADDHDGRLPFYGDKSHIVRLLGAYDSIDRGPVQIGRPRPPLNSSRQFESVAPGGRIVFNPNVKTTRVKSVKPDLIPIWREVLPDPKKRFVAGYLDGHAKLIHPDQRAAFDQTWNQKYDKP